MSTTDQRILKQGVVPPDLVLKNENFRSVMLGLDVPHQTYVHICGVDIVRDQTGAFMVLEDMGARPPGCLTLLRIAT